MRLDKLVYLISETGVSQDDDGNMIETMTPREVFAKEKSVRQTEFYQAAAQGLLPVKVFEIRYLEYREESKLTYEGRPYKIIRTFSGDEQMLELICEYETGGGSGG
jgi:SPP1 family predicted phage head-tail adaptor